MKKPFEISSDTCEMPEGWPDTHAEKVHYAQYTIIHSLEYYSPVLSKLKRLCDLYQVSSSDDGESLPDVIVLHEVESILKNLLLLKDDLDDSFNRLMEVRGDIRQEGTP